MKPRNHRKSARGRDTQRRFDDLTTIKGIGESLERWFREQLDVCSFSQLAELSVEEVESLAREHGRSISQEKIRDILGQAAALASQNVSATDSDASVMPDRDHAGVRAAAQRDGCWREYASFMVYFERTGTVTTEPSSEQNADPTTRTTLHHLESGEQVIWEGAAIRELFEWINQRLLAMQPGRARQEPGSVSGASTITSGITIDEIRIIQAQDDRELCFVSRAGEGGASTVHSGIPFCIEVGGDTTRARGHLACGAGDISVELFAHRLDVPAKIPLGCARCTAGDGTGSHFDAVLPSVMLEPGSYRINCLATVDAQGTIRSFLRGPFLQAR